MRKNLSYTKTNLSKNNQRGFAMPVVIGIIALIVIIGGIFYFATTQQPSNKEDVMEKEGAMMEKKEGGAMMEKKDTVVTLSAQNNSGQSGKATLQDVDGKTKVVIDISSGSANVEQPAHIHAGACPNPGAVAYPLSNVVNGKSETIVDVSMETLKSKLPLAVNVHKSAADVKTYVSCGDIPSETMMKKEGDAMMKDKYSGAVIAGKSAPLLDFNKSDYDAALKTDKLIVLYFYANWCPICKVETVNALYPAFNELTTDKVVGFRVNYNDNQTDNDEKNLAKEFGVAYQHTKVFLKDGQRVLKSPEGWNKSRYLEKINKY